MTASMLISSAELKRSLEIVEVKPGLKFTLGALKEMLPDAEAVIFFGKLYQLDAYELGNLMSRVLKSSVAEALVGEGHVHSVDLQDYITDIACVLGIQPGEVKFEDRPVHGEILPHLWEQLEVEIASSIQQVADKLKDVVSKLQGKQGEMLFRSLMVMNKNRPTIGDYRSVIHHAPQSQNLVILDVSGSMTPGTVSTIVEDVVALAYKANAHLAIVSNTCTYWQPGTFGVDEIMQAAEFGGTHYEELYPLFDRDWGVVVTIADYDSSPSAKSTLASCVGRIDTVLDISLVNTPTYLAQCVGQLSAEVRPLLIASDQTYGVLRA